MDSNPTIWEEKLTTSNPNSFSRNPYFLFVSLSLYIYIYIYIYI